MRGHPALGKAGLAVQADVSKSAEVLRLVKAVEERLGPVDILVNNSGITRPQPLEEIREEDWDELITVNLKSAFLVTQQVVSGHARATLGTRSSTSPRWPRTRAEWWGRTMLRPKQECWG